MGNTTPSNEEEPFHARYALGEQLGHGAHGRVHACLHRGTRTSFAVKIIDRSARMMWSTFRFRQEVELGRAVRSRNVVEVIADFVEPDCCYIVMERFEGHLKSGLKWSVRECEGQLDGLGDAPMQHIVHQVLSGIRHLHSCSIVHRDVKARNVFVDMLDVRDARCRCVLGDLGVAKRLEHGRLLRERAGTRKYWAPELYDMRYSHLVDVFALGVLLFFVAFLKYPYLGEDQTRGRDVFDDAGVLGTFSPAALEFLALLLKKDPLERPSAANLTRHGWLAGDGWPAEEHEDAGQTRDAPAHPRRSSSLSGPPQVVEQYQSTWVPAAKGDAADEVDAVSPDEVD